MLKSEDEFPIEYFSVDLGDCMIESYNPDVDKGNSDVRRVADQLVSKKIRDVVLAQTGFDVGEKIFETRVVRMPNEFVVIPMEPTIDIYKKKEA